MPDVVDLSHRQLRLDLRERVPVPVVVVAHVVMVQERRIRTLPRLAQRALVPVDHQLAPVRVQRRHQQQDHLVQDLARGLVIPRRQMVSQAHRHLVAPHFVRVDPGGDQDDGPTLLDQARRLHLRVHAPRVRQAPLDLQVVVQPGQVRWARDRQCHERSTQRRLTQRVQDHPVAGRRQRLQVGGDLGPVRQLPVRPHLVPQNRGWRRDRGYVGRLGRNETWTQPDRYKHVTEGTYLHPGTSRCGRWLDWIVIRLTVDPCSGRRKGEKSSTKGAAASRHRARPLHDRQHDRPAERVIDDMIDP